MAIIYQIKEEFKCGTDAALGERQNSRGGRGVALRPAPHVARARRSPGAPARAATPAQTRRRRRAAAGPKRLICQESFRAAPLDPGKSGLLTPQAPDFQGVELRRERQALLARKQHRGEYLCRNESFIHGFRLVLGQKQRELVHQARLRLHGWPSGEPQRAERPAGLCTCAVPPAPRERRGGNPGVGGKKPRGLRGRKWRSGGGAAAGAPAQPKWRRLVKRQPWPQQESGGKMALRFTELTEQDPSSLDCSKNP